jgi:phage/plasmid-like protein (TIGR03299 family)
MPASIATQKNGQAALWLNGQPAWHHLGFVHDLEAHGPITVDEVLEKSGLGKWRVEKRPTFWGATEDSVMGLSKQTEGQNWATVRVDDDGTETHLGTVGEIYEPFQNPLMFDFLRVVTGQDEAYIESAGELAAGATVFASMRLGEDIILDGKGAADRIQKYLMVKTSHNGKGKFGGFVSPIRPVCTNTVNWAVREAETRFEIRHTAGGLDKIKEAERTLKITRAYYAAFEKDANELYGIKMTTGQFDRFVTEAVLPIKKDSPEHVAKKIKERRDLAHDLFESAPTNTGLPKNRWRAAMALTELIEHNPAQAVSVPKSLRIDAAAPKSLREDIAKGARLINGTDDEKKTAVHKALLTWKR